MFGYKETISRDTRIVFSETVMVCRSRISSALLDRMCGISFTMGFNILSRKAEMFEVALFTWETIGLTLIGSLWSF